MADLRPQGRKDVGRVAPHDLLRDLWHPPEGDRDPAGLLDGARVGRLGREAGEEGETDGERHDDDPQHGEEDPRGERPAQ